MERLLTPLKAIAGPAGRGGGRALGRSFGRSFGRAFGRALAARLLAERDRWALWLPVGFGTGIAVYFGLGAEPPWWLGPAILTAAGLGALTLRRWMRGTAGLAIAVLAAAGMVAAGFTAAQWRTASVAAPMLMERVGPTAVSGRIARIENFPRGSRVTVERVRVAGLGLERTPEKVRLRLRGDQPALGPGDWIRVRAILSPPPAPAAPGAFDFQRQSYFRGLGAVGFNIGPARLLAMAGGDGLDGFGLALARARQGITERVLAGLDGPAGAVAAALMTGERSTIAPALMDSMRDSGLAHLLAISGLHIGLVAGILFVGVRAGLALAPPLALRFPIKKWAAVAAIVGAFAYAVVAGATVPTQRAFLMVGLVLLAVLVDRRGLSVRLVAWAALIVLVLQPESLLGASFQMSFAAVTALIAAYEAVSARRRRLDRDRDADDGRWPPWARRAGRYLGGVALTTVIAGAATAP
ncbi:MAG: ComEC/Rec2 family competence protein, partial [Rhodospirillales bacterium]